MTIERNEIVSAPKESLLKSDSKSRKFLKSIGNWIRQRIFRAMPSLGVLFHSLTGHAESDHRPPHVVQRDHAGLTHSPGLDGGSLPEALEIPSLKLQVGEISQENAGRIIGLSKKQRQKLGLDHPEKTGQVVEVTNEEGESSGLYLVGETPASLQSKDEVCSAHGFPVGSTIIVQKPIDAESVVTELSGLYDIEKVEAEASADSQKKREREEEILKLNDKIVEGEKLDPHTYITIPAVLLVAAGIKPVGPDNTHLPIAPMTVHYQGHDRRLAVVPSESKTGNEIGFTEKAAAQLGLEPYENQRFDVEVKDGVLVLRKKV